MATLATTSARERGADRKLPPTKENEVLLFYWGLKTIRGKKLKVREIAKRFEISRQTVYDIRDRHPRPEVAPQDEPEGLESPPVGGVQHSQHNTTGEG